MEEQWKEIPEFNGAYQISSYGRLKSVERTVKHPQGSCVLKEKILSEVVNKRGYIEYQITHNGNHYSRKAHRLVAEAFIPNVNNLPQVNHIDAVKTNNHVENLEWCDNQHNILHAYEHGLNRRVHKIEQLDIDGKVVHVWQSSGEACRLAGYNRANIHAACKGKLKTYKGYIWRYKNGTD